MAGKTTQRAAPAGFWADPLDACDCRSGCVGGRVSVRGQVRRRPRYVSSDGLALHSRNDRYVSRSYPEAATLPLEPGLAIDVSSSSWMGAAVRISGCCKQNTTGDVVMVVVAQHQVEGVATKRRGPGSPARPAAVSLELLSPLNRDEPVGAEKRVTSRDLQVFVDEAAEPVSS